MKMLLCSRPRSFRLCLCSRWKPRSHQSLVSRILRQWLMSFSSFWNCLSRGQWRHSSPHSLGDNWVWQWASTRTSSRWSMLTCWALRNQGLLLSSGDARRLVLKCGCIENDGSKTKHACVITSRQCWVLNSLVIYTFKKNGNFFLFRKWTNWTWVGSLKLVLCPSLLREVKKCFILPKMQVYCIEGPRHV